MKLLSTIITSSFFLAALLAPAATDLAAQTNGAPALLTAPDFTLQSLDGERYTLSKLRGKVVLINFWATWCGPCRREIPDLTRLHDKYGEQGFIVLGISMDDLAPDQIKRFADNYKISYPVLHGPYSELMKIAQAYGGIGAIPTTFLVDKQGKIRAKYIGARNEKTFLADIIPLL